MQIMDYLSKTVRIDLPRVQIQKTPWYFPAQKTLKRREDRIANAQASFEIKWYDHAHYRHVVIIDDAVWSGATLAEIGNKLIDAGITDQVTWFSVVGTANSIFDQVTQFEVLASV
jgi:predicted amidophosphoribosyltransferase